VTIRVLKSGKWHDIHTTKTRFPFSNDVDIAVFETDEKLSQPFAIAPAAGAGGVAMEAASLVPGVSLGNWEKI